MARMFSQLDCVDLGSCSLVCKVPSVQISLQEAISYLRRDILDSSRTVGDEHRRGLGGGPNLPHGVKVLGDQDHVHDVLGSVPGTFSEKASTLSLSPSTMAWRCLAIPTPARYLDSASPSAFLIWSIFSASAFSLAATLILAAVPCSQKGSM
uniref:Uncharacterized protein n=1 Tax=Zea mays TaxID=4577 RepID=B4FG37_MAIZE|nr:unknown [Zea mays]